MDQTHSMFLLAVRLYSKHGGMSMTTTTINDGDNDAYTDQDATYAAAEDDDNSDSTMTLKWLCLHRQIFMFGCSIKHCTLRYSRWPILQIQKHDNHFFRYLLFTILSSFSHVCDSVMTLHGHGILPDQHESSLVHLHCTLQDHIFIYFPLVSHFSSVGSLKRKALLCFFCMLLFSFRHISATFQPQWHQTDKDWEFILPNVSILPISRAPQGSQGNELHLITSVETCLGLQG